MYLPPIQRIGYAKVAEQMMLVRKERSQTHNISAPTRVLSYEQYNQQTKNPTDKSSDSTNKLSVAAAIA